MGADVDEVVAVRRAAAEVAAFDRGLAGHGRAGATRSIVRYHRAGRFLAMCLAHARVVGIPLTLPMAQLTELKAAYLIAFTVLGYSWATSSALDSIRAAVQSGDATTVGSIPLFETSDPQPELANNVLVAEEADRLAVIGDDPRWGVLLPLRQASTVVGGEPSLSMNGYAVPWLPDRWWRQLSPPAFRWDCQVTEPRWRVELETSG